MVCGWWWTHRNRKTLQRVGATAFNGAMASAAEDGHVEIVELCKEWGATNFNQTMVYAALFGHVEIVKLSKEWGQRILTQLWLLLRKVVTSKL